MSMSYVSTHLFRIQALISTYVHTVPDMPRLQVHAMPPAHRKAHAHANLAMAGKMQEAVPHAATAVSAAKWTESATLAAKATSTSET